MYNIIFWLFIGIFAILILSALVIAIIGIVQYYKADEKDRMAIGVKSEDWLIYDFKKKYHW